MGLHEFLIRTRLLLDESARVLRACFPPADTGQRPRRQIELDSLEDRVHFDAAPVVAMVAETVGAAQLDDTAGMLDEAVDAASESPNSASQVEVYYHLADEEQESEASTDVPAAVESSYLTLGEGEGGDFLSGTLEGFRQLLSGTTSAG